MRSPSMHVRNAIRQNECQTGDILNAIVLPRIVTQSGAQCYVNRPNVEGRPNHACVLKLSATKSLIKKATEYHILYN